MPYITIKQEIKPKELTWLDVFEEKDISKNFGKGDPTGTITRFVDVPTERMLNSINVQHMISLLKSFNQKYKKLFEQDKKELYSRFYIPKRSGGLRPIDAPCKELQDALRELKNLLCDKFGLLYHTSAFAYVTGRNTVSEVKKHQLNESNWFLKTDFSGFFPSTTLDFAMKMLSTIFPLSEVCTDKEGEKELRNALSLGFLNGSLPQGAVLSPFLTNLIMVPIDHRLFNDLNHHRIVYTRYADDIHISCIQKIDPNKMIGYIRKVLKEFGAPYEIKDEKTHFGNRKGKNFLLGLMLNADNNITVGHKRKKFFKAMTANLIMDYLHKKPWPTDDVEHYQGLKSYYMMVEPEYFKNLTNHFNEKYHVDLNIVVKRMMTGNICGW